MQNSWMNAWLQYAISLVIKILCTSQEQTMYWLWDIVGIGQVSGRTSCANFENLNTWQDFNVPHGHGSNVWGVSKVTLEYLDQGVGERGITVLSWLVVWTKKLKCILCKSAHTARMNLCRSLWPNWCTCFALCQHFPAYHQGQLKVVSCKTKDLFSAIRKEKRNQSFQRANEPMKRVKCTLCVPGVFCRDLRELTHQWL